MNLPTQKKSKGIETTETENATFLKSPVLVCMKHVDHSLAFMTNPYSCFENKQIFQN
jgi:hypothetical protein